MYLYIKIKEDKNIVMVAHWIVFSIMIPLIPVSLTYGFLKLGNLNSLPEEEKKKAYKTIVKTSLFFWLLDFFYMSCFTNWMVGKYIFGILAIILIFVNLTNAFLAKSKISKWNLLLDFLLGVAISIYLIYIIQNETLQTVVVAIVSATYGGLLTLVGVAWTINDSNIKRREDLERTEKDRKEEERKKNIPYVRMDYSRELPPLVVNSRITEGLDFGNSEDRAKLNGKSFVQIMIKDFQIKNVSNTNIIMHGVIAFEKYHEFTVKEIVESGAHCMIKTTNNYMISAAQPEQSIFLITSDLLGNKYKTECHLSLDVGVDSFRMATTVGDEELIGYDYKCHVSSLDLPILIENAKID